jgi:hypothetical protein
MVELLTLAALVIYGAVRFADSAFYARLGVTPDDVGLDYARTLGRVAGGIALLAATVAILMWAGSAFSKPGDRFVNTLGFFAGMAAGGALLKALLPPTSRLVVLALAVGLAGAGAVLGRQHANGRITRWVAKLTGPRQIVLAAVAIVAIFGYAGVTGYRAAGYVVDGRELPCGCSNLFGRNITLPWASASAGFLGVQADRASVKWISPSGHPRQVLPEAPIYLGAADEMIALYDPELHDVVRLPVSAVSVMLKPTTNMWSERG